MKNFNMDINVMSRKESAKMYDSVDDIDKLCDTRNKRELFNKVLSSPRGLEMFTMLNEKVMTDYNKRLIDDGFFPSEKEVLERNNIIDIRRYTERPEDLNSMPTIKLSDLEYTFLENNDWIGTIPCFEKGTIIVNKYRYLYFELKEIDMANHTVKALIQDFEIIRTKNSSYWEPGIQVEYEVKPEEWHGDFAPVKILNKTTINDIYNLIPASSFDWTKDEKTAFGLCQSHSKLTAEKEESGLLEVSFSHNFVTIFTIICVIINAALDREKLRTKRDKKINKENKASTSSSHTTPKKEFEENDEDTIRRLTRYVGKIKIKSPKPPRRPTEETIIKYKVASWPRRGYIRHNKNGTTSVIPPTVCNRHGMENNNSKVKQTLIIQKPDDK